MGVGGDETSMQQEADDGIEGTAPYALFSDTVGGGLNAWNPTPTAGEYRITLTAFCRRLGGIGHVPDF